MAILLTDQDKAELLSKCKDQHDLDWINRCIERPIEQIQMRFYLKHNDLKKFPDQIFIYYMVNGIGGWLYKKEKNMIYLTSRAATREECIVAHLAFRYKFLIYNSWQRLIDDEITTMQFDDVLDREFIDNLRELSKKHILRPLNNGKAN